VRRGSIGVIPETITPTLGTAWGWTGIRASSFPTWRRIAPRRPRNWNRRRGAVYRREAMREARDLALAVFQRAPGDQLTMEIQRGKERMSKTVAVLERKNEPSQLEDLVNYDAAAGSPVGDSGDDRGREGDGHSAGFAASFGRGGGGGSGGIRRAESGLAGGRRDLRVEQPARRVARRVAERAEWQESGDAIALLVERYGQLIYVSATLE